jgi:hypothetical protein
MDAGTGGAGDYAGGGGDSEGIGEVLGGGGDNEDSGGGYENSSDVNFDEESRNSREGIVLALAEMGKHLQSMMATQGLLLATSQNLQERIRMRKRRGSGGSSSEEEPRSGRGNSSAGQKAIYQPREPTGLYSTVRGDADPRTFYRYVHFTREEFDEIVEIFRAAIEEVIKRLFDGPSFSPDRFHNRPEADRYLLTLVTACSDRDTHTLSKFS